MTLVWRPAHLIQDHPVRIDLGVALGVEHHRLIGPEVRQSHLCVLGADVDPVNHLVLVKVRLAYVAHSII